MATSDIEAGIQKINQVKFSRRLGLQISGLASAGISSIFGYARAFAQDATETPPPTLVANVPENWKKENIFDSEVYQQVKAQHLPIAAGIAQQVGVDLADMQLNVDIFDSNGQPFIQPSLVNTKNGDTYLCMIESRIALQINPPAQGAFGWYELPSDGDLKLGAFFTAPNKPDNPFAQLIVDAAGKPGISYLDNQTLTVGAPIDTITDSFLPNEVVISQNGKLHDLNNPNAKIGPITKGETWTVISRVNQPTFVDGTGKTYETILVANENDPAITGLIAVGYFEDAQLDVEAAEVTIENVPAPMDPELRAELQGKLDSVKKIQDGEAKIGNFKSLRTKISKSELLATADTSQLDSLISVFGDKSLADFSRVQFSDGAGVVPVSDIGVMLGSYELQSVLPVGIFETNIPGLGKNLCPVFAKLNHDASGNVTEIEYIVSAVSATNADIGHSALKQESLPFSLWGATKGADIDFVDFVQVHMSPADLKTLFQTFKDSQLLINSNTLGAGVVVSIVTP